MSDAMTSEDLRAAEPHTSRRDFLDHVLPLAAIVAGTQWLPKVAMAGANSRSKRDVLVVVFLRGGMDGLSTCVPYGDPDLYLARPNIAVPPPGNPDGALDLDGFFGLHPAAAPLLVPFHDGRLALVHATGSTDPTRSHFDAYKFMEFGIPNQPGSNVSSGWLARHLLAVDPSISTAALRGVSVSSIMPLTLTAAPKTLNIPYLDRFTFVGGSTAEERRALIERSFAGTPEPLRSAASDTFATFDLLDTIDFASYVPDHGAVYPDTPFGTGVKSSSALLKANVGVECLMLEITGWDLHARLVGSMGLLLAELSQALQAFYLDQLDYMGRLTLVVMSEFGRRVAENGSKGADHGHGNCMMVMGGHVAGGQVLASWPGLAPAQLDEGDLRITIDYRDILAEIVSKRLADDKLGDVFPNYTPTFRGLIV